VVSVCDAYEAMISERPYSVAMVPERAMEELRQGAGTQFDPSVVAAFERVAAGSAPIEPETAEEAGA
jgi:HD-GYP domain-containing protein (c-di-GMP phosphodiesterase class II)